MKISLIALSLISAVILISPASASAATNAGVKPGSFWYDFDLAFEKVNLFFTFNSESKARKALQYADERLAEAEAVAESDNTDAVKTAISNYENNIAFAAEKSKEVSEKGKAEALLTSIADNTSKHQEILNDVLAKVPDEAKEAITKAIEVSRKGQEEAMKQIAELKDEVEQLKKEVAELKELKQNNNESQMVEIKELKKKQDVGSASKQQTAPVSDSNKSQPSNTILCNGKYWTECPVGQKFYCPATGDAQCIIEKNHSSSLFPELQATKNCMQWALETYEKEKASLNARYEQCNVEHPGVNGLILCSGILKSPTDYSSSCGIGSSGGDGSIYSPPSSGSSALDTFHNDMDKIEQENRLKELERKQWEMEQEQKKRDNEQFFNCIQNGGSYLGGVCKYY